MTENIEIPVSVPISVSVPVPIIDNDTYILSFDPGTVNMAYCLMNINTLKIVKWGLFSIKDSTNEGSCKKLATVLTELDLIKDKKVIIVHEQQPRCNIKTITVCGQLQMFYTMYSLTHTDNKIVKIIGYHAKNKLKYYVPRDLDEPMPLERLNKLKAGHYKNKQVAIEHCRRVLKYDNLEWVDFFEKSKKIDDLSDVTLMSLSYIKTYKLNSKA